MGGGRVDTGAPLLSLRDVTISFGGLRAVNAVSFDVPERSVISLIGPNGAGKTTVLNSISGFVRARGSILYGERELLRQPAYRRASFGIGRTFQNLQLFNGMSVVENVLAGQHTLLRGNMVLDLLGLPVIARERKARENALETLAILGIERYANRHTAGLPFGVQKLLGVARALAARPRLLLLDEPAAGLNRREAETFGSLIAELGRSLGLTILLVEHNMRLVMDVSDHIVVLADGSKLTEGSPSEVGRDAKVIAAYLGESDTPATVKEARDELAHDH
jgi:branched-chain amino acid transport system ATP-binding protein